jgi:glycosyltransferase involved in cell wall biosynthesis
VELIDDGCTGLLVNPARPPEIAEAVVRVIRDRAFATRLAEQAFEMVQTRFALDTCTQATLAFYGEVCLAAKRGS